MEYPCNEVDISLFYTSTTITIGNGTIASFWDSPWLNGLKPKDIATLIFESSKRKKVGYGIILCRHNIGGH
jgi:hypothetical protein